MRMRLVVLVGLAWAMAAQAGVLVVGKTEQMGGKHLTTTYRMSLDPQRVRVDTKGDQGESIFIYVAPKETMYIINPGEKTYMEMTRQQVESMANQVSRMRAMMEEKLKNMPPEQRRMMEKMMHGRMGGMMGAQPAPAKTVYRKVAGGEKVGQWTADRYEGDRNGAKVAEVWSVGWSALGLQASDFTVFQRLASMFRGLASRMKMDLSRFGPPVPGEANSLNGFPVRRIQFHDGKPSSETNVLEITRKNFDDSLFQVPPGLTKKQMPRMPSPR